MTTCVGESNQPFCSYFSLPFPRFVPPSPSSSHVLGHGVLENTCAEDITDPAVLSPPISHSSCGARCVRGEKFTFRPAYLPRVMMATRPTLRTARHTRVSNFLGSRYTGGLQLSAMLGPANVHFISTVAGVVCRLVDAGRGVARISAKLSCAALLSEPSDFLVLSRERLGPASLLWDDFEDVRKSWRWAWE
jgi:hypothetical protein